MELSEASDWLGGKEWPCLEDELFHEGLHPLRREGGHGGTDVKVVVHAKRDHFFKITRQKIQPGANICTIAPIIAMEK